MKVLFFFSFFISSLVFATEIPEQDLFFILTQSSVASFEDEEIKHMCTCWQKDRNGKDFAAAEVRIDESSAYSAACVRAAKLCSTSGAGGCSEQSSKKKCRTVGF